MIGERIGNYRILSQIGQGGMGTVYQAEDTQLGRKVAIKVLHPKTLADGSMGLERFQSEARIQANLNQANVVTLLSFEPYKDSYCMVMEYVEGKTLAELIRSTGPFPSHIAVMISKQVLDGLAAAHRQGVVHRDLKPSNIMLTAEGVAKVMDFGIAKVEGGKSLTASGAVVGTVSYMSPEQVRSEPLDARSDLYSFGVILFELLTGRVPFKDDSDFSNMIHHVHTPPPPPSQLLPDVPSELEDIVLRCLNKLPDQRYQNAGEILAALDLYEERERAMGRGELFARKLLVQWLAAPSRQGASVTSPAPTSAQPASHPEAPALPVPPIPAASSPVIQTPPPPPLQAAAGRRAGGKAILAVAVILLVVLAAGAAYLYYGVLKSRRPSSAGLATVETDRAQAGAPVTLPAADPAPPAGQAAVQTAPVAQSGATPPPTTPRDAREASKGLTGTIANATRTANPPPVRNGAPPAGAAAGGFAGAKAASASPALPARQQTDAQPGSAEGFLILLNPDPSGEKLSLAMAQARVADLVREAGHQVMSASLMSAAMNEALAGGDYAGMRRLGVGYVMNGTAHGSVEPQTAYGSTYYVAQVSVSFELVRTADGKVIATGSNDAKSKGSANAAAALNNALMAAASDAVRELLRKFPILD